MRRFSLYNLVVIKRWVIIEDVFISGPQRTSPTVPKNMPTPQRVMNTTVRKNPSLTRNGGGDAEIMELNQQVESLGG